MAVKCEKCKRGKLSKEGFCDKGCDYIAARAYEQRKCEEATGMKYGEPFFVYDGLKLIASGGEAPCVILEFGGKRMVMEDAQLRLLGHAIVQGQTWCEKGYAEGIC